MAHKATLTAQTCVTNRNVLTRACRSYALALAAVLVALCAAPTEAAEIGRETLLSAKQSVPWRGVGRVNTVTARGRGMCTGTLIAPDLVLTAAHCLFNHRTGKPLKPGQVHFVAGWHKGKASAHSKARALVLHPDWNPGVARTAKGLGADLALIRLVRAIPGKAAKTFPTGRPPLPGDPVVLISYRRDRAHALSRQSNCRYRAVVDQLLTLDCKVIQGASGAPVFHIVEGRAYVVAVLAAMARTGTPKAYAARIDNTLEKLLTLMP